MSESLAEQKKQLKQQISQCMLRDRHSLRRRLRGIERALADGKSPTQGLSRVGETISASAALVAGRRARVPTIEYPELPVSQKRETIAQAIAENQVVVVAGETGSGKTTQLPKICLELGRGITGTIGHTQPRRLAARSVASRIAEELRVPLGEQVGYQVRFSDQVTDHTLVKLMTDGILLAETQNDRFLEQYDTLIIDEAHERSLNIDFLLGYIKRLLPRRPDLKVIITSATIDVERFSRHFDNAPIVEVSGRTYPVEVLYRPLNERDDEDSREMDLQEAVVEAIDEIERIERQRKWFNGPRDILVFMSTEREIRETAETLRRQEYRHTEVLPLYARLSASEQQRVFQSHTGRRIVLATNVAETSLTVPGIRYVIDPGFARISRYSYRSKVQRLPIEPVSQASANQRKGRCGRIAEGVCIRLYSEEDYLSRPEFTDAEILRTNLASVILQMLNLRLGEVQEFPFVDMPDRRFIKDGFNLLQELGACDSRGRLTPVGRKLGLLPVDPRIARMVLAGAEQQCLREVLIIASALSIQDPRERPVDKQQAADEKHRQYRDEDSDFISCVKLWDFYEEQRQELSQSQLRKLCKKQFLSYMRMREWRDVHRQLRLVCKDLGYRENAEPVASDTVHKALLTGLLSHLGQLHENKEYLGARNRKFHIFPGSSLFKKTPKWVMAAELVETSKLYARINARIDPAWVEPLAEHLVKKQYFEPHWEKKRAQVVAFEKVTLYGLPIVPKRKVNYGPLDPETSRDIFIRSALVEGEHQTKASFFAHNQQLIEEVDQLEAKSRRRDILVDPETLYAFYDELIPEGVHNGASFERWRKQAERDNPKLLHLTRDYLMQRQASEISEEQYPDHFQWQGMTLQFSYHFEPGAEDDGVTLSVPASVLKQLPDYRLEWLVPGMLREKCVALLKGLPKQVRKNFVPIPDYVDAALEALVPDDVPLTEALGNFLYRTTGVRIPPEAWNPAVLEPHMQMNIRVLDAEGKPLGQGRDLVQLRERFADQARQSVRAGADQGIERDGLTAWDFDELPEAITQRQAGIDIKVYPALVDQKESVGIRLFDNPVQAQQQMRKGLVRLLRLTLSQQDKYLRKNLPRLNDSALLFNKVGKKDVLVEDILHAAFDQVFLQDKPLPYSRKAFEERLDSGRNDLVGTANELAEQVYKILKNYHEVAKALKGNISLALATVYTDIQRQLDQLVYPGFVSDTAGFWLAQYPRYLKAIFLRLEKAQNNLPRERMLTEELVQWWQRYETRLQRQQEQQFMDPELTRFRWMLEEYRVSLFAQQLGTAMPISDKRLAKQWDKVGKPL